MATIDKDLLLDKIDRLLKLHNYAREDWFANVIHNTVWDAPEIETDGDLISRADAIEAVRNRLQSLESYASDVYRRGLYEAQDIIEALPSAEAVQGWIPCSERLPKEKQEVYVTVYFTEGDTGRAYGYVDGFGRWHLYSTVEGTLNSGYDVTAWMPLPEPYEEVER